MITAGIDMGSRSVKVVLLEELNVNGAPQLKYGVKKAHIMMPGDLDQDVAAEKAYDEALAAAGLKREDVKVVFATGAGRKQVSFAADGEMILDFLRNNGIQPVSRGGLAALAPEDLTAQAAQMTVP